MYLILISCLPVATHEHNYLVHSNTTVVSSLLWKQSLFAWKRRRVLGKQCNPTRPLWPCGNGWFSGPSYSSELVFFRSRKGLSITCLQFCIRNCRWPWLCMSSDTCEITPGSANLSVCFSKRVSNSWLPLPASSVEKEPNGIRIQKLPGRSEWDPYPEADGFWHCDNHRSMYLAICFLTVLTAAGDEQFEESPWILKGLWGHPLKSVPCPQLLHFIKYEGMSFDDFCLEAWRHGSWEPFVNTILEAAILVPP